MLDSTPIVFVVDDDSSVRNALERLIDSAGWRSATFASALEFLAGERISAPSCLVLDVSLPDLDGLELQRRLAADRLDMPIIFITGYGDVAMTVRAMKAGALEFLTKPFDDDVLLGAIAQALERNRTALRRQAEMRTLRDRHSSLSRREREVMSLVCSGLLNKQVASELGISEITVKAHRGRVMRKMKARSLADLVRIAARLGVTRADAGLNQPAMRIPGHRHDRLTDTVSYAATGLTRSELPMAAAAELTRVANTIVQRPGARM